jgi:hypothetical protein
VTTNTHAPCADCGKECSGVRCADCHRRIPARDRSGDYGKFQLHASHLTTQPDALGWTDRPRVDVTSDVARSAALTTAEHVPAAEVAPVLAQLGITREMVAALAVSA